MPGNKTSALGSGVLVVWSGNEKTKKKNEATFAGFSREQLDSPKLASICAKNIQRVKSGL